MFPTRRLRQLRWAAPIFVSQLGVHQKNMKTPSLVAIAVFAFLVCELKATPGSTESDHQQPSIHVGSRADTIEASDTIYLNHRVLEGQPPELEQGLLFVLATSTYREAWGKWPKSIDDFSGRFVGDIDLTFFDDVEFKKKSSKEMQVTVTRGSISLALPATFDRNNSGGRDGKGIGNPNYKIALKLRR